MTRDRCTTGERDVPACGRSAGDIVGQGDRLDRSGMAGEYQFGRTEKRARGSVDHLPTAGPPQDPQDKPRRARLYAGSLASLGCYAALARDGAVGAPVAADREGVAIRSSTPR